MISNHVEHLRDESAYLRQILRGEDIPGFIMIVMMLIVDISFACGSASASILGASHGFFLSMNTVVVCFYFCSKRICNENCLLLRMLLRVAVVALLIWIARIRFFI